MILLVTAMTGCMAPDRIHISYEERLYTNENWNPQTVIYKVERPVYRTIYTVPRQVHAIVYVTCTFCGVSYYDGLHNCRRFMVPPAPAGTFRHRTRRY
jgi:hypothetical protein